MNPAPSLQDAQSTPRRAWMGEPYPISLQGQSEQSTTDQTTEIYFLKVPEAGGPRSRRPQGWFFLRAGRKDVYQASLPDLKGCLLPAGPFHHLSSVHVCNQISSSYKDTSHME